MKKSIFLLFSCFFFFQYEHAISLHFSKNDIETIESQAQTWIETYVTNLSPEEIQIIANELYLSHTLALLDSYARELAHSILLLAWQLHTHTTKYTNSPELSDTIQKQIATLDTLTSARNTTLSAWKACITYASEHPIEAFEIFINYAQQASIKYLRNQQQSLHEKLDVAKNTIQRTFRPLYVKTQAFQAIIENPHCIWAANDFDDTLIKTDIAVKLSNDIIKLNWQTLETLLPIIEHEESLQEIARLNCAAYYKVIYKIMLDRNFENQFMTIMFDSYGLIAEDQRIDLLPNPYN